MSDELKQNALDYHEFPTRGKLALQPTKPMNTQNDLALAYSPGVAFPCLEIEKNPLEADKYTARGNLVGVISNGTAVLGLGNIGALASKPVMEGKAVLFKKFADIDVFDIEVDEQEVEPFVEAVKRLEPTFGGINLEDIKSPECFFIERRLREEMNIPVFHDDQHGTAIVSAAAVYNALRIVDKKIGEVKLVVSRSGAASIACVELLISMGLDRKNLYLADRSGVVYKGRTEGMNPWKEKLANDTHLRTLAEVMVGADIFLGLSAPGLLTEEMVKTMGVSPLILAMANPTPEIMPELAKRARPDAIIATGRSDYPNQVNNVLCFPFIFRGALDCGATTINEEMKLACVKALADLVMREPDPKVAKAYKGEKLVFGPDYIIPKPFDPRLIEEVPVAVVQAAMDSGVATRPIEDMDAYRQKLHLYNSQSRLFMQPIIDKAKTNNQSRIVFVEGENHDILSAIQIIVDEKIAKPVLLGRPVVIQQYIDETGLRLNLDPNQDNGIEVINPYNNEYYREFCDYYHHHNARNGASKEYASHAMNNDHTAFASVMVAKGYADGLICGKSGRYLDHLKGIKDILVDDKQKDNLTSICVLLMTDKAPLFITDAFVNPDPTEQEIIDCTSETIKFVQKFGVEPQVALLSHSNYGSYVTEGASKMRSATGALKAMHPTIEIEGEMHSYAAFSGESREDLCAENSLTDSANVLIMPNMDSASISLGMMRSLTPTRLVGPYLVGAKNSAHILIPSVSSRGIFNMTALMVADLQESKG